MVGRKEANMQPVMTAGPIGLFEVLVIAAIVIFGGKKLGEFGKGLGEGIRNFKTTLKGDEDTKTAVAKKDEEKVESNQ